MDPYPLHKEGRGSPQEPFSSREGWQLELGWTPTSPHPDAKACREPPRIKARILPVGSSLVTWGGDTQAGEQPQKRA